MWWTLSKVGTKVLEPLGLSLQSLHHHPPNTTFCVKFSKLLTFIAIRTYVYVSIRYMYVCVYYVYVYVYVHHHWKCSDMFLELFAISSTMLCVRQHHCCDEDHGHSLSLQVVTALTSSASPWHYIPHGFREVASHRAIHSTICMSKHSNSLALQLARTPTGVSFVDRQVYMYVAVVISTYVCTYINTHVHKRLAHRILCYAWTHSWLVLLTHEWCARGWTHA